MVTIPLGKKTTKYPHGYGYCQCGCGKTTQINSKSFRYGRYFPRHSPKWLEENKDKVIKKIPSKKELIEIRCRKEKSIKELAEYYDVSQRTINNWLNKYGIDKFYLVEKNFFKKWTPEMSWILGIIYTDGYLYDGGKKRHQLRISQKDRS